MLTRSRRPVMRTLIALALALAMSSSAVGQQASPDAEKAEMLSTVPRNSTTVTEYYRQDIYDKSRQKIGQIGRCSGQSRRQVHWIGDRGGRVPRDWRARCRCADIGGR